MSTSKKDIQGTNFHQRLKKLLGGDVKGWAIKLGVSESNIRDRWFKGSYPGTDKIIKILEHSDVSPEWLLTGKNNQEALNSGSSTETIGERLIKLRMRKGLSQAELGYRTIVKKDKSNASAWSKIKRLELGEQEISLSEAIIIADYFKVDLLWLITGDKSREIKPEENHLSVPDDILHWMDEIFSSHDETAINALYANIAALKKLIEKDSKIESIQEKINQLNKQMEAMEKASKPQINNPTGTWGKRGGHAA